MLAVPTSENRGTEKVKNAVKEQCLYLYHKERTKMGESLAFLICVERGNKPEMITPVHDCRKTFSTVIVNTVQQTGNFRQRFRISVCTHGKVITHTPRVHHVLPETEGMYI